MRVLSVAEAYSISGSAGDSAPTYGGIIISDPLAIVPFSYRGVTLPPEIPQPIYPPQESA